MTVHGGWAIGVETVRPVSAGALAWRSGGEKWALAVVVKATFSIVDDAPAELIAPNPLCREDRFAPGAHAGSILEEPDLAPYKPQVDVTFVGSVHAPHPVQALRARLAVFGDDHGFDKSVQAVGDRAGPGAAPLPFRQMPLGWERTWASPDNPIGVSAGHGPLPNVIDPARPQAPAGFGPIARGWPSRARLLGTVDRRWIEGRNPELPHEFRWEYFQAAPGDQRIARLRGGETILLENLLEGRSRVRTRLPSVRACARLHAGWLPRDGQLLDLVADTLAIDGDAQAFSVVWRASIPLPRADASLEGARVVTGVELPGFPMPWPDPRSPARTAPSPAAAAASAPMPPAPRASSPALPRLHVDDDEAGEGTALLPTEGSAPGPLHRAVPGVARPPTPLAPPSAPIGSTLALTPEDAMRLIASAPRPVPFPGDVAPPPPADPVEEATRQMSVSRVLDEITASIDLGPPPGTPQPPPAHPGMAPAGGAPTTMALTPEQAAAMLAAAGRQRAASGGFPPPLVAPPPPLPAPPPPVPGHGAPPVSPPGRVTPPPPVVAPTLDAGTDDEVDGSGATFALTPELAQQMMADAARKSGR